MRLTDDVLAQNTSGRAVTLDGMRITDAAPMGARPDVTRVSITNCGLEDLTFLPAVFPGATNVNLSANRLSAASLAPLLELGRLTVLNLTGNRLEEFPTALLRAPGLKALILAKNRIRAVPDLAGALGLGGAGAAPAGGKAYSHDLNTLVLSGNPLAEVAEDFSAFPALRKVGFSHCGLRAFPVVRSPGIREMRLSNNRIPAIPEFERLQGLNQLDLGANEIAGPEGLAALSLATRLKQLVLSGNPCMGSAEACSFLLDTFRRLNRNLHINGGSLLDFEAGKNRGAGKPGGSGARGGEGAEGDHGEGQGADRESAPGSDDAGEAREAREARGTRETRESRGPAGPALPAHPAPQKPRPAQPRARRALRMPSGYSTDAQD